MSKEYEKYTKEIQQNNLKKKDDISEEHKRYLKKLKIQKEKLSL
ncbi:hypothetical protein DFH90_000858 [Clostridium saccharobutylicum]|nr:hypothetical protein [Clostridium saccharobutylicum]